MTREVVGEVSLFDWLRDQVPLSDGMYFSVFIESLHLGLFLFFTAIFLTVERLSMFNKYRIRCVFDAYATIVWVDVKNKLAMETNLLRRIFQSYFE